MLLCLVGIVWAVWRHPRQAALPLLLAVSYYVFSLRSLGTINVKYTLPLQYLFLMFGGAVGGVLLNRIGQISHALTRRVAMGLAVIALGCALVPAIEIDRLIVNDPRYAAETWLQAHVPDHARVETYQSPTRLPRFSPGVQVQQVPMADRTVERFQQRQPDFVVLSSGGRVGLTHQNIEDWEPGQPKFANWELAQAFFDRLHAEELGYRQVARFYTPPRWITPPFGSVNPEITILTRNGVK
jgi:hypothetical protein